MVSRGLEASDEDLEAVHNYLVTYFGVKGGGKESQYAFGRRDF